MDDLTRINGVGPSTARALEAAGIGSFAALAAADAGALAAHPAFRGLRASPRDLAAWIAAAAGMTDEAGEQNPGQAGGEERDGAQAGGPVPPADPSGGTLIVRGPKRGRWRIGRFFGPEGVEIAPGALSEDEMARLVADPRLSVETRSAS